MKAKFKGFIFLTLFLFNLSLVSNTLALGCSEILYEGSPPEAITISIVPNKEEVVTNGQDKLILTISSTSDAAADFKVLVSGSENIITPENPKILAGDNQTQATVTSTKAEVKTITTKILKSDWVNICSFNILFSKPAISSSRSEVKTSKTEAIANSSDAIDLTITVKDMTGAVRTDLTPEIEISGSGNYITPVTLKGSNFLTSVTSNEVGNKTITVKIGSTKIASILVSFVPIPPSLTKVKIGDKEISPSDLDGETIDDKQKITLYGETIPNATVTLYAYSEPKSDAVKSDDQGSWLYSFSEPFSEGEHRIEATVTDENGRTSPRVEIAKFKVVKATSLETQSEEDEKKSGRNPAFYIFLVLFLGILGGFGFYLYKRWKKGKLKFSLRKF